MSPAAQSGPAPAPGAPKAGGGGKLKRTITFAVGWVLVPLLVVASVVASGVHQGAYRPDAWYVRTVRWLVENLGGG